MNNLLIFACNNLSNDQISENISIIFNSRTSRPVGYAFVDFDTSEAADSAVSQLSGGEILARKVNIQKPRKSGKLNSTPTTVAGAAESDATNDDVQGHDRAAHEEVNQGAFVQIQTPATDPVQPSNWNPVNNIRIRTTLGAGSAKTAAIEMQGSQELGATRSMGKFFIDLAFLLSGRVCINIDSL